MRLLLCEDEKALSDALVAILRHNNYSVDAVYNGTDAVEYIKSGIYDGVVLDIMMPGLDGIGVLRSVRAAGVETPIMILTAKGDVEDKIMGLDSGADDYLTKPFDAGELLARIRAMTRRKSALCDNILTIGDIRLDRLSFELIGSKGRVSLTAKEYQIMEILMQNKGRLISAELLMEKIWGYDSDTDINVVWTYISYLRKKLGALGSTVTIRAVRGIGYLIEEKVYK